MTNRVRIWSIAAVAAAAAAGGFAVGFSGASDQPEVDDNDNRGGGEADLAAPGEGIWIITIHPG